MSSVFPPPARPLPAFKSILFEGSFPPSAPIHLCLSHTSRADSKAIILSPSRRALASALVDYNDDWLEACARTGKTARDLSQIDIFYPPSAAHLALLLSMLRVSQTPEDYTSDNMKTVLERAPALTVLHEPSSYLVKSDTPPTVSSYLSLIARTLAAVSLLSAGSGGTALAVFDSQLHELKLPVLKPPTSVEDEDNALQHDNSFSGPTQVRSLAAKYFEWVGTFEDLPTSLDEAANPDSLHRRRLGLRRSNQTDSENDILWQWSEVSLPARGASERPTTVLEWD
ncbi:hypothetical protein PLICRDRAFT_693611 [Plicaturopsis crispa FD-325 SS-3]|nr:hypothetical protein PLICRDRAFT_693611 [Plicaturopsis crispa FD-325 SS-3]